VRVEDLTPSARTGSVGALPPAYGPVLQHEMRGHEVAAPLHEPRDECVGDPERRVRDDVEVATRKAEVCRVCLHHDDAVAELLS
jgi:hypothetical protein